MTSPHIATLMFDLTDPDARDDFTLATGAVGMARALTEIQDEIRRIDKYADVDKISGDQMLGRIYAIVADAINAHCRETLEAYR